ncbi:MAG: Gfo/Idh/MocA family oxidoreductase [Pirellulales bacterium]|nr:Gfo/Idh/MocA family oxidoreductase [Pirellulales bacterium]
MTRHGVLIVGVGSIGERHLRCWQATGRADLCFCEPKEPLRSQIAQRYKIVHHYGSLDEALADHPRRFDVAVIATPAPQHIAMATQLVRAGVHALIEKPLSLTGDGILELMELVRRQGVVAAVAFTYRSHPALEDMKRALDTGRFGRPVEVVSVWGQHFPTYRPAYREIYYATRAMGGGIIQDLLPHAINAAEWLVGPVDRLMADAAHLVLAEVDVEDTVHVITRHSTGVLGCYTANQYQAPNENSITVICEDGTARFDLNRACWQSMTVPGGPWQNEFQFSLERDDIFINQANRFLDILASKAAPACTLSEGMQTLRVTLAILDAVENPGWRMVSREDGDLSNA